MLSTPSGPGGSRSMRGRETRAFQFQRAQLGVHRLVERRRRVSARLREIFRSRGVIGRRRRQRPLQLRNPRLAGVEIGKSRGEGSSKFRQSIDGNRIFAARRAKSEQPLFDLLQFARIELGVAQRLFERLAGYVERAEGGVQRLRRRLDQSGGLRLAPLQPAQGGVERRHRRLIAADRLENIANVRRNLFRLHHPRAARRQGVFLAGLRFQLVELGEGVTQIFGVGARLCDARLLEREGRRQFAQAGVRGADLGKLRFMAAISVDQLAMGRRIHKRAIIVLAVNFDEFAGDLTERLRGDALVVDKGLRAAVGHLHTAQNEAVLGIDVLRIRGDQGGMARCKVERRRNLALRLAGANEGAVAARP